MKSIKFVVLLAVMLFALPLLTACGPTTINATLTSYKLELSSNEARAGDVIFHVTNAATDQKHEFVIFKTDLPEDQLPLKTDELGNQVIDEEGPGVTHIDEIPEFEPGLTKDLTVKLDPGRYVIVCNLDVNTTHYMHGMHAVLNVK